MGNRFEHLKNTKKNLKKQTPDSFIEEASQSFKATVAKKHKDTSKIILSISSKMNREQECEKPMLFHMKKDIANDIESYCNGNKQAILNYLLKEGLQSLLEKGELILL